jgi:hypothetical protein
MGGQIMSNGETKDGGKDRSGKSDWEPLIDNIFVLLNHLQRQSDNRLQAHFDDTRLPDARPLRLATPPSASYAEFQTRLTRIKENGISSISSGEPKIDDLTFLRWSKDFLAAVAAPATVESISITREYMRVRAEHALKSWGEWWQSLYAPAHVLRAKATIRDERFQDTAHWLARQLVWLERWTVLVTVLAVVLSAHAMVGRLIIDREQEALKKFQELTKAADEDYRSLLQLGRAQIYLILDRPDHSCPAHLPDPSVGSAEVRTVVDKPSSVVDGSVAEKAWSLVEKCRGVQWALMQLVTENIRLKSWDGLFIALFPLNRLIGWDNGMIDKVGAMVSDKFCRSIARSYQERFDGYGQSRGCAELIGLLARDSGSVASSILACVTMSILPCLYAFVGAAAASMMSIRRRTDAALLSYTDRGRVKLNVILGFVFGAIIGLFAGHLSLPTDSAGNALGLSAVALLAGYNVPAVSDFLDDLSNRLFRPPDRSASRPA